MVQDRSGLCQCVYAKLSRDRSVCKLHDAHDGSRCPEMYLLGSRALTATFTAHEYETPRHLSRDKFALVYPPLAALVTTRDVQLAFEAKCQGEHIINRHLQRIAIVLLDGDAVSLGKMCFNVCDVSDHSEDKHMMETGEPALPRLLSILPVEKELTTHPFYC
jgi:hypothetical protein